MNLVMDSSVLNKSNTRLRVTNLTREDITKLLPEGSPIPKFMKGEL